MRRATMLIGEPCVGKSRVMKAFLQRGDYDYELKPFPMHVDRLEGISVFGRYDDLEHQFPGTDRLSMNVAFTAYDYVRTNPEVEIVLEGARLGTSKFIDVLLNMGREVRIGWITCEEWELRARRALERSQNMGFIRRGQTRSLNIAQKYPKLVTALHSTQPGDIGKIVDWMVS